MSQTNITHDYQSSVLKAVCIILMVVGHSGAPQSISAFIYLFHMPAFFFISGYLFKDKYLSEVKIYLKRKIKGLWWPYVKWSLIFLLMHNAFAYLNIYDTTYSIQEILKKAGCIILMVGGTEVLLGGFWFLKDLLIASIISFFALYTINLVCKKDIKVKCIIIILILILVAYLMSVSKYNVLSKGSRTFLGTAFFMSGYAYNKIINNKQKRGIYDRFLGLIGIALLIIISLFYQGSMGVKGIDIFIYYIVAMIGTLSIYCTSYFVRGKALSILDYIGSNTLYILIFHFLSFKIVSLVKIMQYNLPIKYLSHFPVIFEHNSYYWILYSIIGVIVPIMIRACMLFIKNRYNKDIQ